MGESLSKLFIPLHSLPGLYNLPEECLEPTEELLLPTFGGVVQLFFLAGVYAPIVGSVVLPILGAVPDGAIVLFSGLGDIRTAQKQLSVGVGALAGSTIMLLTLPWLLSIVGGRVNIDAGHCTYRKPSGLNADEASRWKKLDKSRPFFGGTGVEPNVQTMRSGARTMIWTCIGYVIIQGSAFAFQAEGDTERIKNEKNYALAGLIFCILAFGYYLWNQIRHAGKNKVVQDVTDDLREQAIRNGMLSLSGAFMDFLKDEQISQRLSPDANSELLHHDVRKERFTTIVKKFYRRYDVNNDGKIDNDELKLLLQDLHVPHDQHHLQRFLEFADHDNSGDIQFEEFVNCMLELVLGKPHSAATDSNYGSTGPRGDTDQSLALLYNSAETGELDARRIDASASETISASQHGTDGDDDEEEEEEIPEDLADLPPQTQQRYIMLRSFKLMGIGTFLILLFSDPMVDVLSEIGDVIGVPAFYISFILAPLASNASELIAAYGYSVRKTSKTITISLSTLEGAAIMNNTFCLGIFLALVYFRGLEWSFSAETISIILVQLLVAIVAYQKIQTMVHAVFVGALFPLSILLVAVLESDWVGLD